MRDRLMWAMDDAELTHSQKQEWLSHLHFAKLPLTGMSDVGANFIPYLVSSVCGPESDTKQVAAFLLASMQLRGQGYKNTVLMQMGQWRASRKVLDITSGTPHFQHATYSRFHRSSFIIGRCLQLNLTLLHHWCNP